MSTEAELVQIGHEIRMMRESMQDLANEIHEMTVTNQKVLMVLLEIVGGDDPDQQPQVDMEGNPV